MDYPHNVVVMGFARACLSKPRWVRIGAVVDLYHWGTSDLRFHDTALSGFVATPPEDSFEQPNPPLSPRIYRG